MRRIDRQTGCALAKACFITLLLIGCDSDPQQPEEPENPVAGLRMEARSSTNLTGTVGARMDSVLVVRLTTLDGEPAPGREIRFSASGGGTVQIAVQRTDTAGLASPGAWTLGTTVRRQTLTARSAGVPDLVFSVMPEAGPPAAIDIVDGNAQMAAVGAALPAPLRVHLADQYGNPIPDVPLTFTVILGNGAIAGGQLTTDALGFASSGTWSLGGAGAQLVKASAAGKEVLFEAFACEDPCRGRDFLFTRGADLYTVVAGDTTPMNQGVWGAAWSPNGQLIAYAVYEDFEELPNLYVMNADGSNATLRATGFWAPSWSPDGTRLAVSGAGSIYVMSAESDGAAPVLLAEDAQAPAWSPDGTKIAFVSITGDSLKVMNADGSAVTTLATIDGYGDDSGLGEPSWSPDGQHLAFSRCNEVECNIFAMSASGTDVVQLTRGNNASSPAWSPEGSRIAFWSDGWIAWLPPDGSLSTPIPMLSGGSSFAWRP